MFIFGRVSVGLTDYVIPIGGRKYAFSMPAPSSSVLLNCFSVPPGSFFRPVGTGMG